jgi:hypothetical protein
MALVIFFTAVVTSWILYISNICENTMGSLNFDWGAIFISLLLCKLCGLHMSIFGFAILDLMSLHKFH